jgi:glycosyltransferase involved in cell wall biosynthesis
VTPPASGDLASAMDRRAEALRRVMTEVDVVLAPTAFARDRALEFGVSADKVRLLPYGVLRERPRARSAGRRRRFGFIGTLAPHKGVHVLVEAFRGLPDPDATLDIHGSLSVQPAYADALRAAAAGDARIRFHGAFAEGGQEAALAGVDVLVVPSVWWENSPLTILEALGAGRAVIASRIGGVPELVPEGAGLLVPPDDATALRQALTAVARGERLAEARDAPPLKTAAEEAAVMESLYH